MKSRRKVLAWLYPIWPCILIIICIGSCVGFRDFCIANEVVKIRGLSERDVCKSIAYARNTFHWITPSQSMQAKKEVRALYNKYWWVFANEDEGIRELRGLENKYKFTARWQ